jgi:hypothetical protein
MQHVREMLAEHASVPQGGIPMRRIAAILLCIAMCLTVMPWVAHAEGTVQYAAVTATELDWSDANLFSLGDPEGGGGAPPGGGAGALEEFYDAGSDGYVVGTSCTVSPEKSVDLVNCSITVTSEGTLTVQAGARVDLRGVSFTNEGTIIIEPRADNPDPGRIEIRDDEGTDGTLHNYGTITVGGSLVIEDGAQLVNYGGGNIVVEDFLRLGGGAQLSNSGSVTVEAGGRVEVTGAVFNNEGTIDIEADTASNPPEHGRIEIRDDRYYDEEAEEDIVTPGVLVNHGTITVCGNLEINDGAELVNDNDEDASIVVENFLRLSGGAQLSNSGSVTVKAGGRVEVTGAVFNNEGTIDIEADTASNPPEHGRIEIRDDRYYDEEAEEDIVTPGVLVNQGTITVGGNLEITDGAELINDEDASIVVENFLRLSGGAQLSNSGSVTVKAGASAEVTGAVFTNNGTIVIEADQAGDSPEHGRIEIRDDRYYDEEAEEDIVTPGVLVNQGTITVGGNLEITDGAELINDEGAGIFVDNFMRLAGGAQLSNSGSVTGGEHGHIELFVDDHSGIRLTISGLGFYDSPGDAASDDPITDNLRGSFSYDSVAHKWIRSEGPGGGGGDPGGEGPRPWRIYTDFGIHGWVDGPRDVDDGGDATFTLMPDEGFVVGPVTVTRQETGTPWDSVGLLTDEGDGTCSIVVMNVTEDLILSVTFVSETPPTVDSILQKSYAILVADADSPEAVEAALRGEIDGLGYVDGFDVTVTDIDLPGDGEDYGTFRFTVAAGVEISPETTGYIVREPSNILFKVVGEHESLEANEVLMADSDDAQLGVFELPAMDSGIIEVLGVYSAGVEGWLSPDVADGALTGDRYRIVATQPFYRLQMHIANRPANPADEVNWFGFDVIQADAYCVFVDASDGAGQQRTLQWELNRYAQLTTGDYTSQVFFGNDRFTLSLPPNGLGGVTEFSTPTGTFQGYQVSHDEGNPVDPTDDTYTVEFLSDFYDRITLEITINGSVTRKIHIHRVGVEINAFDLYGENRPDQVFHGTQYGSKVHYDDGTAYHIFATYCIPDGEDVPYGLYVTFTWADGSTTTKIIGAPHDPHKDPVDPVAHLFDSVRGVFVYPEHADPVDYLIYEAPTSAGAPVKVNVLVLKDDPNASGIFGGVFFGSGAGVEWQAD